MQKYYLNLDKIKPLILLEAISGSNAYGTALPTSDVDIRGLFIQPLEHLLGDKSIDQVSDSSNDITFYEIGNFLQLVSKANPNILEILNIPEDCIRYKHPLVEDILIHKNKFLTKRCRFTFGGYAVEQIRKSRGLDKKMNWEESEMKRKSVLDFCYVLYKGGSKPFKSWLEDYNKSNNFDLKQESFGLANIDHAHDTYALYYDNSFKWGIVSNEETSNDVQLTSIPKDTPLISYLYFNKDGYTCHCKKYKEYQEWLKKRNVHRVQMVKDHGKRYDGKNLAHCYRLINTACDIATKGELIIRRSDDEIKKLMSIRKGEYEYEDLLNEANEMIEKMDKAFIDSSLPNDIDPDFVTELLISIRKKYYKI